MNPPILPPPLVPENPQHREGRSSFIRTSLNGLNAVLGVGILSTPYALAVGGWACLFLLFMVASITFYTGLLIRRVMDSDPCVQTYPDMGGRAFGKIGRVIAMVFSYIECFFVATGILILGGDNLHNLFPTVHHLGLSCLSGRTGFTIIVSLVILPTVWIQNMRALSYVSAAGLFLCFVIICSVIWSAVGVISVRDKETALLHLNHVSTALSLYSFCYSAHPVFPMLYNSMNKKQQYNKVLLTAFLISTTCYALIAILGYLMYGGKLRSELTLNLPTRKISSKIAIYATLLIPITKYAIVVSPIASAIENRIPYTIRIVSILVRTLLLFSTLVIGLAIPFFGELMSFVGAFSSATASIIIPCICYLKITGGYKQWSIELVSIILIILMACYVVVAGTYASLSQVIAQFQGNVK